MVCPKQNLKFQHSQIFYLFLNSFAIFLETETKNIYLCHLSQITFFLSWSAQLSKFTYRSFQLPSFFTVHLFYSICSSCSLASYFAKYSFHIYIAYLIWRQGYVYFASFIMQVHDTKKILVAPELMNKISGRIFECQSSNFYFC